LAELFRKRRWQKSPVTGESAKEAVKTIARGKLDVFGGPVVTTLVCLFHFAREATGAAGHPAFPAPSLISRDNVYASPGRHPRRGKVDLRLTSLRGAKRRSNPSFLDWQNGLIARNDGVESLVAL